jgi:hypothetical protein
MRIHTAICAGYHFVGMLTLDIRIHPRIVAQDADDLDITIQPSKSYYISGGRVNRIIRP